MKRLNGPMSLFSQGIPGLDSISNWDDQFTASGFGPTGLPQTVWPLNTVGDRPSTRGTTNFNAPIIPVIVSLRDANGDQAFGPNGQPLIENPVDHVQAVLHSPVFQRSTYTSSPIPTQFTDAIQRAEYFGQEQRNWHTELSPSIKAPLELDVPFGSWVVDFNTDGSIHLVRINENAFIAGMFPPTFPVDNSTVLGQAELNGDITPQDISTFQFQDTVLFEGTPSNCCVVGFHTFDFEPGATANAEPRAYVMNFNSWTTPGIFRNGVADITALSHEMSETFNDPFVDAFGNNFTPWWLAPNGLCQDNRETGDVIEQLPDQIFPITMHGFTYHPQNEALNQYFEFQQPPSDAIDGAFSYPDESVLSGPSAPQNFRCRP
ncbi:MAG TPA: hypothetical protein VJ716_03265 [Gaiellaceae bacterium]|nr:hypothetical protein [Gaiellaceae bacterium]